MAEAWAGGGVQAENKGTNLKWRYLLCQEEMEPALQLDRDSEAVEWGEIDLAPDLAGTVSVPVAGKWWFTSREHPVTI